MYLELSGTYIAQGGERYLTIGNFDDLQQFVFMHLTKAAQMNGVTNSYLNSVFIDDVSLVSDTTQLMMSLPHSTLGHDTTLCTGDSMRLSGDNPYFFHYWWNTGDTTRSIIIDTPGTYWCTVDYGCSNYTDTIHVYAPLQPYSRYDTLLLCNCDLFYTYRLPPIPGNNPLAQYHWSDGSRGDSLLIRGAGLYSLYRSDACGLANDTVRITVDVPTGATPAYLPDTTLCSGDSITLSGGGGYRHYRWSTGDTSRTIRVGQEGGYKVLAYTACDTLRDSAIIRLLEAPPVFSLGADTSLCPGSKLSLSAPVGPYSIRWQPGGATTSTITADQSGGWTCLLSNICGQSRDTLILSWKPVPAAGGIISGAQSLCQDGQIVPVWLYNNSVFGKKWSTGDTGSRIRVSHPGYYGLRLYNECGSVTDSVYERGCKGIVAFPNAFSPNGDGKNDVFRPILQDRYQIEAYLIRIFNRWGQCVFVSGDPESGWDGGRNESGTYFYFCRYKERGGTEQFLKGELELLR